MRVIGAIGAIALLASGFLPWVMAPFSGESPELHLGRLVALGIGLAAALGCRYHSKRLNILSCLAGSGLCCYAVFHLALWADSFPLLLDENDQYAQMVTFSRSYFTANLGIEPTFQARLLSATLTDRLGSALYFMSWGWWLCLVGSILILASCLHFTVRGGLRWTAVSVLVIVFLVVSFLFTGLAAQYFQEQGDRRLAKGLFTKALRSYEKAVGFSPGIAGSETFTLHMGEAYYRLGTSSHPSVHFYLGDSRARHRDFEGAIAQYLLAPQDSPPRLRAHIQRAIARAYVFSGLISFEKGEIGPAAGRWERALSADPQQVLAVYFLTQAYFDQGRYGRSIAMGRYFLDRSRNRMLNANVEAKMGDGYWKLGDFNKARVAYRSSMRSDPFANFRILRSLGGT